MDNHQRLDPNDVANFFRVNRERYQPAQCVSFTRRDDGVFECCALTGTFQSGLYPGLKREKGERPLMWAKKIRGNDYAAGVMIGWDHGAKALPRVDQRKLIAHQEGIEDGAACWKACVDAGLTR